MRNAFAKTITQLAGDEPKLILLSGDIGNRLFDQYKLKFAERFFNCGVAEANMAGMAAGMAMCGLRPVTYTISTFNTYRCIEQIRIDICYHRLPVIIVGVGAGLSYAGLGGTHQALEDIALLRMLPHMKVLCPGDSVEVKLCLQAALRESGPVYIRLGKKNEPLVHQSEPDLQIGKGIIVQDGVDVCLLSTGTMLPIAQQTAQLLESEKKSTRVVSLHTVKPLDTGLLQETFKKFALVVTLEEHSIIGGLGSAVAEWKAAQTDAPARLLVRGIGDQFVHQAGNQTNARRICGLVPEQLAPAILHALSVHR